MTTDRRAGGADKPVSMSAPVTVYPSRSGVFPPASFRTFADALVYIRELQEERSRTDYRPTCGICTCPPASYFMHYGDTHL